MWMGMRNGATRVLSHAERGGGSSSWLLADGRRASCGEECFSNPAADLVHLVLQAIEVFVESPRDDRLDAGVRQLGAELPKEALDRMPEHPCRRPRDGVHRPARPHEAVLDGARELLLKQQELDDAIGRDAAVTLPVHLERAG